MLILSAVVLSIALGACGSKESKVDVADSVTLLNSVWDSFAEEERFAVVGGDSSNMTEGPGKFDISKTEEMENVLGLPEKDAILIADAASMVHMMNANTFTCGVFHGKKAEDAAQIAKSLEESIKNRRWMCGFPDKMLIVTVGDYTVSAFGIEENMDRFKDKLTSLYPGAEIVCDKYID